MGHPLFLANNTYYRWATCSSNLTKVTSLSGLTGKTFCILMAYVEGYFATLNMNVSCHSLELLWSQFLWLYLILLRWQQPNYAILLSKLLKLVLNLKRLALLSWHTYQWRTSQWNRGRLEGLPTRFLQRWSLLWCIVRELWWRDWFLSECWLGQLPQKISSYCLCSIISVSLKLEITFMANFG